MIRRIVAALLLLLVAGVALADSSGGSLAGIHAFRSSLTPPESDYSVAYLNQIFGTVGTVLQGSGSQILGKLFDIFNKGVLVAGALWLAVSTVQMVFKSAGEGSFMGQNRNTHWVLLRIALGFGLMVPSATTGYSIIQDLFMKVVVEGVGLADQTWDAALNYIEYGGSLYIPPSTLSNDNKIVSAAMGSASVIPSPSQVVQSGYGVAVKVFQDEVCMIASSENIGNDKWTTQTNPEPYNIVYKQPVISMSPNPMIGGGAVNPGVVFFPGLGDPHNASTILQSGNAACGSISAFDSHSNLKTLEKQEVGDTESQFSSLILTYTNMNQTAFSALKQMAKSIYPAAKLYVHDQNAIDEKDSSITSADMTADQKEEAKDIFSAITSYTSLMTPYQNLIGGNRFSGKNQMAEADKSNSVAEQTNAALQSMFNIATPSPTAFIPNAEARGWIMAGGLYWSVEQANGFSKSISMSKLFPATSSSPTISPAAAIKDINIAGQNASGLASEISTLWSQYVGAQQNNIVNTSSGPAAGGSSGLAQSISKTAEGQTVSGISDISSENYNPISILMNLGNEIIAIVSNVWLLAITASISIAVVAGICASEQPGFEVEDAGLTWVKSIMMLITGVMLLPGIVLCYYVPLYPFAVFTFAAVGWMAAVIEGMAAAPLVCLGVTHPEGHDFLGKAEQALMLFLGIFVRPALMIIGLIAAMVVSFVAFHMLIVAFGKYLASGVVDDLGGGAFGFVRLINKVMSMVIFAFITMELIEQCYKLIFQIPNYILRWIGGPTTGEDYGQAAKGLQSGANSFARGVGEAAGSVAAAGALGVKGRNAAKKGLQEHDDKNKDTSLDVK